MAFRKIFAVTRGYYRAISKIIRHKIEVYKAGREFFPEALTRWRLLKHDLSKLTPVELRGLVYEFELDPKDNPQSKNYGRDFWQHHIAHNPHHIEYYERFFVDGKALMPDDALKEMVCDWIAAGVVYEGKRPSPGNWEWGKKNLPAILERLSGGGMMPEYIAPRHGLLTFLKGKLLTEDEFQEYWKEA